MPQLRPLRLQRRYADLILSGKKTVEVRLSSRYTRAIQAGDEIRFIVGRHQLVSSLTNAHDYDTLDELLDAIGPTPLGFDSCDEASRTYRRLYHYNADDSRHSI